MLLDSATNFLFVPANRLDRLEKAIQTHADYIVADLEDSVPSKEKADAIAGLAAWLLEHPSAKLIIRVNGVGSLCLASEMQLCQSEQVLGLMVPKCENPQSLAMYSAQMAKPLILLIETAKGLGCLNELCHIPNVKRLALGKVDLALDLNIKLGTDPVEPALLFVRSQLVIASKQANLAPPLDGVWIHIEAEQACQSYFEISRSLGFSGALLIHPKQIAMAQRAYHPSHDEILWASTIIEEAARHQNRAFKLNGQMVDEPVILAAKRIIQTVNNAEN